MIEATLEKWHNYVHSPSPDKLDDLLSEDIIFYSPVVWTPLEGKAIAKMYLKAATQLFFQKAQDFKYVREVVNQQHIILEFETIVEGIIINGIDMMEVNPDGKICSFKVMVRPLKAMNKLHEKMAEMLQQL
jgi:hypothetical protein